MVAQGWAVPRDVGFEVDPKFHPERAVIGVFGVGVLSELSPPSNQARTLI
jgi:hypothetical protein